MICIMTELLQELGSTARSVDTPTCVFPGCDRPRRSGSPDKPGAKPRYCDRTDAHGKLVHTADKAFRARNPRDASTSGAVAEQEPELPFTDSIAKAVRLRDEVAADVAALSDRLIAFGAEMERIADPETAEAQIETVRAEAAQKVAEVSAALGREVQRRQRAEEIAEEAREAAEEMSDLR